MRAVFTLEGADLAVKILDPEADAAKLGSRYCSGGYVWQVEDREHGALLSGPRFPDPEPPPFDGQGLPEVFETALGQDRARIGDDVWVIGVGRVRRESATSPFHVRDNPSVVERAQWTVERSPLVVRMRSREVFSNFALELERTISLDGRTLTSSTVLVNRGTRDIPVRWFAHPFFPWARSGGLAFSLETTLPENAGFEANEQGVIERRREHAWANGCYVVPRSALGGELEVTQAHPLLGSVSVTCRFPLAWLALWGNERTVSFEPFHATVLTAGAVSAWAMEYRF